MTSRNLSNNLWLVQQAALPPLDLYDVEPHEHTVVLRESGVTLEVPVSEIDLGIADHAEVCGLGNSGTEMIGGVMRWTRSQLPRRWSPEPEPEPDPDPMSPHEPALENLLSLVDTLCEQIEREYRWQQLIIEQMLVRH